MAKGKVYRRKGKASKRYRKKSMRKTYNRVPRPVYDKMVTNTYDAQGSLAPIAVPAGFAASWPQFAQATHVCFLTVFHDRSYNVNNQLGQTIGVNNTPEWTQFSAVYQDYRVVGCKMKIWGSEVEYFNVNQIYYGGASWTNTITLPDYANFTTVNVEKMMDFKAYGGKHVQGPNAKIKRYYHTLKEYKGMNKTPMPFRKFTSLEPLNRRCTTFVLPFYSSQLVPNECLYYSVRYYVQQKLAGPL